MENRMYVIAKRTFNEFIKGEKYIVVNADYYQYEVKSIDGLRIWIDKCDIERFDYHV